MPTCFPQSGGYITPFAIAGGTALLALPVYWKFVPEENGELYEITIITSAFKLKLDY